MGGQKIEAFLQYTINGIITGLIYSLVALGFNIIYSTTKIVNFAQGEFVMLGAMLQFYFLTLHIPIILGFTLSAIIVGVVGYTIHTVFIRGAKKPDELALIVLTIGIAMILRGASMLLFGKNAHAVKQFLPFDSITIFGLTFSSQYIVVFAGTVIFATLLFIFFNKTNSGKVMMASSNNPLACRLFGIDVEQVQALSFLISGMLGAIGGSIIAPISFAKYNMGLIMGLKGFSASVVGGFGNNVGAIAGGLIIGVSESLAAGYISSSYKDIVAFLIMILVLFIKPSGIFGAKDIERV